MEPDDDYTPGPDERLEQILDAVATDGANNAILDIIHGIFEDGYQEGYLQSERDFGKVHDE